MRSILWGSARTIAVYGYLLFREDRKTYQCLVSYRMIGEAIGKSVNTVRKYVMELEERGLIRFPPKSDDMEVPAGPPVRVGAIGRRSPLQKPLEGEGQAQLHHVASWGMVTFSTRRVPFSASAIIMVIS